VGRFKLKHLTTGFNVKSPTESKMREERAKNNCGEPCESLTWKLRDVESILSKCTPQSDLSKSKYKIAKQW
jgi:hypothetical protein